MRLGVMAAVAASFVMVVPAMAQVRVNMKVGRPEDFNKVDPHKVGLNTMDKTFMQNAYVANAFEVKAGALAQSHGEDTWTKDYGQDMYREHSMANSELKELAQNKGVYLSNNWPGMLAHNYNKLRNMNGASFDNAFRDMNKQGHMMVMQACANEIKYGHDAGARSYATKMLATARSHEMMVMNHTTMMAMNSGAYGAAQQMKP